MHIRPISADDAPALATLHRAVGWSARSREGWDWLARDPVRADRPDSPLGWMAVDDDGQARACIGSHLHRFRLGRRTLYAVTGHSIIVLPEARGAAHALIRAVMDQTGLFAFYTLNANARSAPLYRRHRLKPWVEPTHALKLSWSVRRAPRLISRALRLTDTHAPRTLSALLARIREPLTPASGMFAPEFHRRDAPDGIVRVDDLGARSAYAGYWRARLAEGGLLADRSPEVLSHRLADPDRLRPPVFIGAMRDGAMVGHALAELSKLSPIDPTTLEILDLGWLDGHETVADALMAALFQAARQLGAAKLRLPVVSTRTLDALGSWPDKARQEGGWGHAHVRFMDGAPDPGLWQPTPYDGDYGFCLRPPPL